MKRLERHSVMVTTTTTTKIVDHHRQHSTPVITKNTKINTEHCSRLQHIVTRNDTCLIASKYFR